MREVFTQWQAGKVAEVRTAVADDKKKRRERRQRGQRWKRGARKDVRA